MSRTTTEHDVIRDCPHCGCQYAVTRITVDTDKAPGDRTNRVTFCQDCGASLD